MILKQASSVLENSPPVSIIPAPTGRCVVTVVGDLHGDLADLTEILKITGYPNPNNILIFNGDFVDRGVCGVEVLSTILALKAVHPRWVYINRGNHEDEQLAKAYEFHSEVALQQPNTIIILH